MTFQQTEQSNQQKTRTRRLRKKLRVGEFQELGFFIIFRFDSKLHTLDQALDHWIEFVESHSWGFSGGGGEESDILSGYMTSFERGSLGEVDRELACQWLDSQLGFTCIQCSTLSDAWHGPWEE